MDHLTHSIAELHQGRKQDDFGWQSISVYYSSGEKSVFRVDFESGDW